MRKPYSAIAVEGYHAIFLSGFCCLIFAIMGWWPIVILLLASTIFASHFFRDPERVISTKPGIAVSPADGKIIRITNVQDPLTGESRQCISIFMSVLNVHVNRMPVAGTIKAIDYKAGRFLNASLNKASEDNERCIYAVADDEGQDWYMVQVAGLIARRIVCRVDEGDSLGRGERYGMIKFGSRVDLYIPDNYTPSVMVGDIVMAGSTTIAHKAD